MPRRKLSSDINVVPYIDVMLVLLIIFMVTAPLLTQGIEIDLPDANAASMTTEQEDRIVSVRKDGQIFLSFAPNKDQPQPDEDVVRIVGAIVRNVPDAMILVEGDAQVPYERVARAMALLQEAGAKKIGFVTQPVETRARDDQKKK